MNIFYLSNDPKQCAQEHCDKHIVKMILEYAQLLSTAHRVIDGTMVPGLTQTGRKCKRWKLTDDRDTTMYQATHVNHPSAVWARQSNNNYNWLYNLFVECCKEYTYRYGKVHSTEQKLKSVLQTPPKRIKVGNLTVVPQAMPEEYKQQDPIRGYRTYYREAKRDFCRWTNRNTPEWWTQ